MKKSRTNLINFEDLHKIIGYNLKKSSNCWRNRFHWNKSFKKIKKNDLKIFCVSTKLPIFKKKFKSVTYIKCDISKGNEIEEN